MNTARRIILSVWLPILVVFPVSLIDLKTNIQKTGDFVMWEPAYLYKMPWFWYLCVVVTGVFLLLLWREPKQTDMPDQKQS